MLLTILTDKFLNVITPILLLASGFFITLKLRGFYFFHPVKSAKLLLLRERSSSTSPLSALCLALAGTLGVGNIVGVASAISVGGFGAVFWMWVSALVAMSLKYAEIVISMKYRRKNRHGYHGGAAYYISAAFSSLKLNRAAKILSGAFVLFVILNSLTTGCMLQSSAISSSFELMFDIDPLLCGVIVSILFVIAILYKSGRVEKITGVIVPIMTALFVVVCTAAIVICRKDLGDAFSLILKNAFNPESAHGGALGFLTSQAFKSGSMRGLVSNEAGAGTAPTAHAMSDTKIPEKQGLMGVFEVFADTIILCTLTALVIILSGAEFHNREPMDLLLDSFGRILGESASLFMCISIFLFAFATLICWAKYGISALEYLTRRPLLRAIYTIAFTALIVVGTVFTSNTIWRLADFSIGIMTIINLSAVFILRREITLPKFQTKSNKL